MIKLVAATTNSGKLQELQQAAPKDILLEKLPAGLNRPQENGQTYLENAKLKAVEYYEQLKRPVIADDGGLELVAFPTILGLKTQRFFTSSDPKVQNAELLALFEKEAQAVDQTFHLHATVVYFDGQRFITSEKQLTGKISQPQGTFGFGFDPILFIPSDQQTMAQMSQAKREQLSPRVQAFKAVLKQLKEEADV